MEFNLGQMRSRPVCINCACTQCISVHFQWFSNNWGGGSPYWKYIFFAIRFAAFTQISSSSDFQWTVLVWVISRTLLLLFSNLICLHIKKMWVQKTLSLEDTSGSSHWYKWLINWSLLPFFSSLIFEELHFEEKIPNCGTISQSNVFGSTDSMYPVVKSRLVSTLSPT